jgi:hypothetical protein
MITKPSEDMLRVLRLVVDHPGEMDAESIGVLLWPPQVPAAPPLKWNGPVAATSAYQAWLSGLRGRESSRKAHRTAMARKASRLLGRLQELALVEPLRPPRLSAWWEDFTQSRGRRSALAALETAEEESWFDEATDREDEAAYDAHIGRLLTLIAEVEKLPQSVKALMGEGGGEGGANRRAYERLVELGVIVPPSYRWPTPAGIAKIEKAVSRGIV